MPLPAALTTRNSALNLKAFACSRPAALSTKTVQEKHPGRDVVQPPVFVTAALKRKIKKLALT